MNGIKTFGCVKETSENSAYELIEIKGIKFRVGYRAFSMQRGFKFYGVLLTSESDRSIGFMTGLQATDNEMEAIAIAREYTIATYGPYSMSR